MLSICVNLRQFELLTPYCAASDQRRQVLLGASVYIFQFLFLSQQAQCGLIVSRLQTHRFVVGGFIVTRLLCFFDDFIKLLNEEKFRATIKNFWEISLAQIMIQLCQILQNIGDPFMKVVFIPYKIQKKALFLCLHLSDFLLKNLLLFLLQIDLIFQPTHIFLQHLYLIAFQIQICSLPSGGCGFSLKKLLQFDGFNLLVDFMGLFIFVSDKRIHAEEVFLVRLYFFVGFADDGLKQFFPSIHFFSLYFFVVLIGFFQEVVPEPIFYFNRVSLVLRDFFWVSFWIIGVIVIFLE